MRALHPSRAARTGFTLIEVLVVVAIIALLISILLPSLANAREQAKRSVCLSNEHQLGLGFGMYSSENRYYYPARDHFTYYIKGSKTIYDTATTSHPESAKPINYGTLYGKYATKDLHIFYCPGNMSFFYDHPDYGAKSFLNPSVSLTFGGYMYGVPLDAGRCPRLNTRQIYAEEYMSDLYRTWWTSWKAANGYDPLKRTSQVLLSDALIGDDYKSVHKWAGYNVLYVDLHAKWVADSAKYVYKLGISSGTNGFPGQCKAWEFFAQHP